MRSASCLKATFRAVRKRGEVTASTVEPAAALCSLQGSRKSPGREHRLPGSRRHRGTDPGISPCPPPAGTLQPALPESLGRGG